MKTPFLLLLLFFHQLTYGQNQSEKELLSQLETAGSDSEKVKTCIALHNFFFISDLDKSERYAKQILEYGKASDNLLWESKGYMGLARCATKRRQYSDVLKYDSLSLSCAQKLDNTKQVFTAKLQLARDFLDADIPSKAFLFLKDCENMSEAAGDPAQIAKTQQTLGWYYFKLNQNSKSIPYYKKAIEAYTQMKDERMTAASRILLVQSLLPIGLTDSIPGLLFGALEYYKKSNSLVSQAECYGLLGQSYLTTGNSLKGIENYLEAKRLYNISNNKVEEALATIDLARAYLANKDLAKGINLAKEAETALTEMKYDYGLIMIQTFWGEFYCEKSDYPLSEKYFILADEQAKEHNYPDLQTDNQRYWTEEQYRRKNYKKGDSLMISYAQKIATQRDPAIIANDIRILAAKNRNIDSNKMQLLKLLYSKQGVGKFSESLHGKSLSSATGMDSLLMVNPFSSAPAAYDSVMNITYNRQLLDMESKYKTRLVSDSLHREQQSAIITRQQIRNKNIILISVASISLLLLGGFALQYRNRKRAERDRQHIQRLQDEIHHRVKNNLGVIQRLVDIAGKNSVDDVPLSSLKTRIKSIELLHQHLYNQGTKPGNISLQAYLEDLCIAIAATFETGKDIKVKVNTSEELNSAIAEKLGLIINEVVTNSYKYAFEGKNEGVINITAQRTEKNLQIAIEDNGVGFETDKNKGGYGLRLIKGLSHELNAKYLLSRNGGTRFQLNIPV